VALKGDETTESLRKILTPIASELIDKELVEYSGGKMLSVAQDHTRATFCKLIESDAARINWNRPAAEIDRLIRAMHGVTSAWTMLDGKMLLVHKSSYISSPPPSSLSFPRGRESNAQHDRPITPPDTDWIPDPVSRYRAGSCSGMTKEPGTINIFDKKPAVACAGGFIILEEVQLAGGKAMSGQAFLNGHGDFLGRILI
jgi:methionyl-tRNA formyltransferase